MMSPSWMPSKRSRPMPFEALRDLLRVFLEALERGDLALEHHHLVAHQTGAAVADDLAVEHHRTGDLADLRDVEDLPHLGPARRDLALDRAQQTRHRLLQRVHGLVDDVEDLDRDAMLLGQLRDGAARSHVEAHDHGPGIAGQEHVRLTDRAHGLVEHAHLHLGGAQFHELVGQRLH